MTTLSFGIGYLRTLLNCALTLQVATNYLPVHGKQQHTLTNVALRHDGG